MYKNAIKSVLGAAFIASLASGASAVPILTISAEGATASQNAETAFLNSLTSSTTENFESYTAASDSTGQSLTLATSVGIFESVSQGSDGLCDSGGFDCDAGLAVLDSSTTPFGGRYATPSGGGNTNWLDSMDATEFNFSHSGGAGLNALGFYMTDPNDAGGRFDIEGSSYLFEDVFGSSLNNGKVYYITLFDEDGLGDLTIYANNDDDGFGVDNMTIGYVPEPGTLALLGLGLAGLGAARRLQKA